MQKVINNYKQFVLILVLVMVQGCEENRSPTPVPHSSIGISDDYFTLDGTEFTAQGVVYVPFSPGYLPWEFEYTNPLPAVLRSRIDADIDSIKALGVNTIRLWGAPAYCYQKIAEAGDMLILQTIWLEGEHADFYSADFMNSSKIVIQESIEKIFSVLPADDPPILAFLVGNELSRQSILETNNAHPGQFAYSGKYIQTDTSLTATEVTLAELADYLKQVVASYTSIEPLVSYANEVRTYDILDTPFLDFRSYNTYSYGLDYFLQDPPVGSITGFYVQGFVEEMKAKVPNIPLLVTETGLSVSPDAAHVGPPVYGYGGNTEAEQAAGILQNIIDIETAALPIAGVMVHEFNDAWWKFGLDDSYTQDPGDIEEWFGITRYVNGDDGLRTITRPAYTALQDHWSQ